LVERTKLGENVRHKLEAVSITCAGRLKKLSIGQNIRGYGGVDKYR
jgi:hypothetical protein